MQHLATALLLFTAGLFFPSILGAENCSEKAYEERIREAELAGNNDLVTTICREWYASGQYSTGVLNWNFNALMSLEANATLITQNEHDTYPALLLQNALDIRPDVMVLNLQLLEDQTYRTTKAQRIKLFPGFTSSTLPEFISKLTNIAQLGANPLYFSVLLDKSRIQTDQRKLYITGLALQYSEGSFDNIALLRYNYENRFRTDYLNFELQPEKSPEIVTQLNLNYIPAFLLLYRHYQTAGEVQKAEGLKELSLKIARAGKREADFRALFPDTQTPEIPQSAIAPKSLDKVMKKVGERLYAAETELTNGQYELFLQDLLKNKDFEQLALCRTSKTDWRTLLPENMRALPDAIIFKNGHPDAATSPVQNISQDAAQRYCNWITQVYNTSDTKKKFKKVLFRLPTETEWELAASGGLKSAAYPWGGYYVRNAKGCYLCNINATEPCGDCPEAKDISNDGGIFTVPAETYYPNNFGLYNVAGNVSEMIQEPGKTKGGSWQDAAFFGQLKSVKMETAPSPTIGVRVFMEVIEE